MADTRLRPLRDAVPAPRARRPNIWPGPGHGSRISALDTIPLPVLDTPWDTLPLWGGLWMGLVLV